jgi:hypothetical protein
VQRLSQDIPTIGIQTQQITNMKLIREYIGRGLPLLLIDSRPLPEGGKYPSTLEDAKAVLLTRVKALDESGSYDFYSGREHTCFLSGGFEEP